VSTTMLIECKRDWRVLYCLIDETLATYMTYCEQKHFALDTMSDKKNLDRQMKYDNVLYFVYQHLIKA